MRSLGSSPLLLLALLLRPPAVSAHPAHQHPHPHPPASGSAASEVSECSTVAAGRMYALGGNAVDAAIATTLCVGTIAHHHSGIGGGGFALVRLSGGGGTHFVDFRETAPKRAHERMFVDGGDSSLVGGLAAAVPGELRGLEELSRRWGRLDWELLFGPAVEYAEKGFTVNRDLDAAGNTTTYPFLLGDEAWRRDWAPHGERVALGEKMYRKRYARTLRAIAKGGADVFYKGAMARRTVHEVRRRGGVLTVQDLEGYRVRHRKVAAARYKGFRLSTGSAPSSGAVMLSALKIFEGWADAQGKGLEAHRLVEGIKFAYGQRTQLGDPDFVDGLDEFQREMVSEEVAARVRARIRDDRVLPNISSYGTQGMASAMPKGGTSHIATLDSDGTAVSLTTTINTFFGSRVMTPSDGVILNNEMDDFSTPGITNFFGYLPTPNNYIRPFKRPLSSISPTIVETADGQVYFVVGAAGGSRIITATVQNVWHVVEKGLDAHAALSSPRLHDQLSPNLTSLEADYDAAVVADMARRGHNVTLVPARPGLAAAQAVMRRANGTLLAVGEPRQWASGGSVWTAE